MLSVAQGQNWPQNPFGKHLALKRTGEEEVEHCIFQTVVWRCLLSFKKSGRSGGLNLPFRCLSQCLNCKSCCSFSIPVKTVQGASHRSSKHLALDLIFSCGTTARLSAKSCGEQRGWMITAGLSDFSTSCACLCPETRAL